MNLPLVHGQANPEGFGKEGLSEANRTDASPTVITGLRYVIWMVGGGFWGVYCY